MDPDTHASHVDERLSEKVRELRSTVLLPVAARYPGKDELVELIGLAAVAGDHLLIVGPPGTAKSEVVAEIARRIGGRYFEYLLTRFTEPSEIFGPVDLKRLREGRFETVTEGRLAEAEIAFLDEIFHAGSAILNTLLGILNDGWFRRGQEARRTPLHFALAATNTASDDPALRALQDRFTLRVAVDPLPDERVDDLLEAGWILERERLSGAEDEPGEPDAPKVYGMDSLRALSREVSRVDVRPSREQLIDLVRRLRGAGIYVSDRRVVKLQRLAAASAILCGRRALIPSDIWPARYLWEHEDERAALMEIATESIERFDGATMRSDPHGAPADHPFAFAGRDPARILAALSRLEDEIDRLGKAPALDAVDALHNRLHDIDRERRWCRVRGPADATALAEIRSRLDELVAALASIGGERR